MFFSYRLLAKYLKKEEQWKMFLEYERALLKRMRNSCRINFLNSCLQADIVPRFLKFRVPKNGCFEPTIVHNFQKRLLKEECNKAKKAREVHDATVKDIRDALKFSVHRRYLPSIIVHSRLKVRMERNEVILTQSQKLDNLSKEQNRPLFQLHDTVRLLDVDVPVPKYVLDTLSMGPKNSVLTKFDPKCFLAEMDVLLNNLQNSDITNETINNINIATLKYVKNCSKQKIPRHVKMTNRFLKENALLAVPFDKGTGICVMKQNTYQEKMNDILSLSQFVKEIPTRKNAREVVLGFVYSIFSDNRTF